MFVFSGDIEEQITTETAKKRAREDDDENATTNKEDGNYKFLDMYTSIYTMRQEMEKMRKPIGTRENPVRSCKDLYYGHPQFSDGNVFNTIQNL